MNSRGRKHIDSWLQEELLAYDESLSEDLSHVDSRDGSSFVDSRLAETTDVPVRDDDLSELLELQACVELLENYRLRQRTSNPVENSLRDPTGLPKSVGRFLIQGELGRGGGGIVFLAEDPQLHRMIALKIPRPESLIVPQLRQRFLLEARATANLQHPNIVPVYEVGQDGTICYLASSYCRGGNLASWLAQRKKPLSPTDAARMILQLARGVQHAHSRGVLHRDIKPSNILLDVEPRPNGIDGDSGMEIPASIKLSDFGLARLDDAERDLTRTGAVLGTPAYMAPEQAEGRLADIAAHTDVWALGAVLYELLTGQPLFQGGSDLNILQQVVANEPVPIRRLQPHVPRDLVAICERCLQKQPSRRYHSAADFVQDLVRFLTNRPTNARPISQSEASWRWIRRHPQAAGVAVAAVAAMVLLVAGLTFHNLSLISVTSKLNSSNRDLERAVARAQDARDRAEQSEAHSQQLLYTSDLKLANQALMSRDLRQSYERLQRYQTEQDETDLRGFEWYWLWQQISSGPLVMENDQSPRFAARYSADGTKMATCGMDGKIRIYDMVNDCLTATIDTGEKVLYCLSFVADSDTVVAGGDDGSVTVWDIASEPKKVRVVGAHEGAIRCLAVSASGTVLATCGDDALVQLWSLPTLDPVGTLHGHSKAVTAVAISPNGDLLASASHDETMRIWDLDGLQQIHTWKGHRLRATSLAFSHDGTTLLSGSVDGTVCWWDPANTRCLGSYAHLDGVESVTFSPGGKWVASADRGGRILMRPLGSPWTNPQNEMVRWCGYSPNGTSLAVATWNRVLFKNTDTGTLGELPLADMTVLKNSFRARTDRSFPHRVFSFSPDGNLFACVTQVFRRVPNSSEWEFLCAIDEDPQLVCSLEFSCDGNTVAVGRLDGAIRLWKIPSRVADRPDERHTDNVGEPEPGAVANTGQANQTGLELEVRDLRNATGSAVLDLALSPDGESLIAAHHDKIMTRWDIATGKRLQVLSSHGGPVSCVTYSPNGRYFASSSWDRTILVWDAHTFQVLSSLEGHGSNIDTVNFAPDGHLLVSTSVGTDKVVHVWDWSMMRCVRSMPATAAFASFSPDGSTLLAGGFGPTVTTWDVSDLLNGQMRNLSELVGHEGRVRSLDFVPGGEELVSAGADGKVIKWRRQRERVNKWLPSPSNVLGLGFSETDHALFTATAREVSVNRLSNWEISPLAISPAEDLCSLAVNGTKGLLAYGTRTGVIKVLKIEAPHDAVFEQRVSDSEVNAIQFSPGGRLLAVRKWHEDEVQVFDLSSQQKNSLHYAENCQALAFSPDGSQLVFNSGNNLAILDTGTATGNMQTVDGAHYDTVRTVAFSPDGAMIVSGGNDRQIVYRDARTLQPIHRCVCQVGGVTTIAFSHDGHTLASGSSAGELHLSNTATGQELLQVAKYTHAIRRVMFSPSDSHLVCLLEDGRVEVLQALSPTQPLRF